MKMKLSLLAGLAVLGFSAPASAQTVINITGATAFRAAAHDSIIQLLGGPGVTQYGFVGSSISNANIAIFKGNIGGQPFTVRTSQSGSTAGIRDVVIAANLNYLRADLVAPDLSTGGVQIATNLENATAAGKMETGVARFSFSDVDQAISNNPTPQLPGAAVGVVPFVFIANVGTTGITNMTDQLHEAQWSTGDLPLSMYTGNLADTKRVLNTGRSDGSGTRATILAETQYGPFTPAVQWGGPNDGSNVSGGEGTGTVDTLVKYPTGQGGYSSNSFVRQNLARTSTNVTVGGIPGQDIAIVSYLTLSDAVAISDLGPSANPATALSYNGVPYSLDNVKNGAYTLWGYQQFYGPIGITAGEQTFFDTFVAEIPNALNPLVTGIEIPEMNVRRFGGDGGIVLPD